MRVADLPLNELYERPKITASVEAAILSKENFSKIKPEYCEKVCKLNCKNFSKVNLLNSPVDVLIIQDQMSLNGPYDKRPMQQEQKNLSIIKFICDQAGLSGLTTRVTSLMKCDPAPENFPKGKAPLATTIMKCRPYLYQEIKDCKPKVIISLSTAVTKVLGLNKHSNTGNRGNVVNTEFGPVVITLHPRVLTMIRQNASGAMWGADYFNIIVRDFEKANDIARNGFNIPDLETAVKNCKENQIRVATSLDDVYQFMEEIDRLPPSVIISFDTETTGLDPLSPSAKLLCIQFGWRDPVDLKTKAVVIPLWHRENRSYDGNRAWESIENLLVGPRKKVAHNGKFDILYIYHTTGTRVQNTALDTLMVLHSISSGNQGCYGLKAAVHDYLYKSGLGGYEDLLPNLTKKPKITIATEEQTEENDNDD